MKPGQLVRAVIRLEEADGVIAIPRGALFEKDGKRVVYRRRAGASCPSRSRSAPTASRGSWSTRGCAPATGSLSATRRRRRLGRRPRAGPGGGGAVIDVREALGSSLESLRDHALRSFLTMLGIIFGVGAVIAMLSIGAGAERQALEIIDAMGLRNVVVKDKDFDRENELLEIRRKSAGPLDPRRRGDPRRGARRRAGGREDRGRALEGALGGGPRQAARARRLLRLPDARAPASARGASSTAATRRPSRRSA